MTKSRGIHVHARLEIIKALRRLGEASAPVVASEIGLHAKYVARRINELRSQEPSLVYIADYERVSTRGPCRYVYALRLNGERDAKPPKPIGNARNMHYQRRQASLKLLNKRASAPSESASGTFGDSSGTSGAVPRKNTKLPAPGKS